MRLFANKDFVTDVYLYGVINALVTLAAFTISELDFDPIGFFENIRRDIPSDLARALQKATNRTCSDFCEVAIEEIKKEQKC